MKTEKDILLQLHRWIEANIPEEELNKDFWSIENPIVLNRP